MAGYCGKCRQLAPYVKTLKEKFERDITFVKVDTSSSDEWDTYAKERGVHALPAFRFYKNGAESVTEVSGYKKRLLAEGLDKLMES